MKEIVLIKKKKKDTELDKGGGVEGWFEGNGESELCQCITLDGKWVFEWRSREKEDNSGILLSSFLSCVIQCAYLYTGSLLIYFEEFFRGGTKTTVVRSASNS